MIQKKICMLGSFSVGKTSLIRRFVSSVYDEKYVTTVGVKIDKKVVTTDDGTQMLMIWDLAGEDDFTGLQTSYLRGAAAGILVIDGTRKKTVDIALRQLRFLREKFPSVVVTVAINKADLADEWEIDLEELAARLGDDVIIHKTSAKTGESVEELFESLALELIKNKPKAA